jgi:hypothetical protein
MCGSGKIHTPLSAIIESNTGLDRYNERFDDGYADLEQDAIDSSNTDRSGALAGRASSDVAGVDKQMSLMGVNGPEATAISAKTSGTVAAHSRSRLGAGVADDKARLNAKLGTVATGQGTMKRSDSGLSTLASMDLNTEISKGKASLIKSQASLDAASSVIAGVTGGALASQSSTASFTNQSAQAANVQATPVNQPAQDMPTRNTGLSTDLNSMTRYT